MSHRRNRYGHMMLSMEIVEQAMGEVMTVMPTAMRSTQPSVDKIHNGVILTVGLQYWRCSGHGDCFNTSWQIANLIWNEKLFRMLNHRNKCLWKESDAHKYAGKNKIDVSMTWWFPCSRQSCFDGNLHTYTSAKNVACTLIFRMCFVCYV